MAWLHEVEFVFEFPDGFGGEALFGWGLVLRLGLGLAAGVVGEVAFAFEAAVGEAGQGIEHAEEIERAGGEALAEGVGADIGEGLADLSGGDFVGDLEGIDARGLIGQIEGQFVAGAALVEEELFFEPVAVAAGFPVDEVDVVEGGGGGAELGDDFGQGDAVEEHLVDLVAEGFGEAGDFAAAGPGIFDFWFLIFDWGGVGAGWGWGWQRGERLRSGWGAVAGEGDRDRRGGGRGGAGSGWRVGHNCNPLVFRPELALPPLVAGQRILGARNLVRNYFMSVFARIGCASFYGFLFSNF